MVEHPVLKTGKFRLEIGHDLVSKLQDRVLVFDQFGNGFDAPGNLGTGRRWFADITLDTPLDMVWKGLRANVTARVQKTRVKDPIWDEQRRWSNYFPAWDWTAEVRRDADKWAYGFTVTDRDVFYNFRTDTIDQMRNGKPFAWAFVEYRVSKSTSLNLLVDNLLETPGTVSRTFYFPNRTNPDPGIDEFRQRNSQRMVQLTLKHSFGG